MDNIPACLRRLLPWRRRSSKQKRCTLNLPAELVWIVLEFLSPESIIAFALTCRILFAQFFPMQPQLSDSARATLLQWLEQDIPGLYFCHDCARLHRWRRLIRSSSSGITVLDGPCWKIAPGIKYLMSDYVPDYGFNLTYSLAQLVTNRHLYGPSHGPSVHDIAATRHFGDPLYGVDIIRSWSAKIINDSLYLHGNMTFRRSRKKGEKALLMECLENYGHLLVCPHLRITEDRPPAAPSISEPANDRDSAIRFTTTSGQPTSCPLCFTDYQVRITPDRSRYAVQKPMENWVVEIARWHKLGRCRSPQDLEWYNLVSEYGDGVVAWRRDICAAGVVCREWTAGDTTSTNIIEGTFVFGELRWDRWQRWLRRA